MLRTARRIFHILGEMSGPVKGNGPWYLVIQVYGKKNPREVDVALRK